MTFFPHAALRYTLPTPDGTNAQALVTDGAGTVSFQTIGGVVNIAASDVPTQANPASSGSYIDLISSPGPAVTITTGTSAILWFSSRLVKGAPFNSAFVSVAVSGATTVAASDPNSMSFAHVTTNLVGSLYRVLYLTGLTAGSNTFTMKYKNDGGAAAWTFSNRTLVVMAQV